MAGLGATTLDLTRLRGRWSELLATAKAPQGLGPTVESRLQPVAKFGSNPGQLQMFTYVPDELPPAPALVVVLHGCTQTAAAYEAGAGWSTLAERYGFVLVCPQQSAANNQKSCFNWFLPGDTARGEGEALSIRQMVERAVVDHGVDRSRIFVTGLSAGGAMAAVMLATYPDVFAAGGIVAGLPYGSAANVQQALQAMFQAGGRPAAEWGDLVRAASPHRGPWPRLSIWHGGADAVVKPVNAGELVKQWTDVHGLPARPSGRDVVDGHAREVWRDAAGHDVIESFTIAGMGHGAPLRAGEAEGMCGTPGAFLLEVGISSSYHLAKFWGLANGPARQASARATAVPVPNGEVAYASPDGTVVMPPATAGAPPRRPAPGAVLRLGPGGNDIGSIITGALKAAGLMKG